jgi:hypothetical protein
MSVAGANPTLSLKHQLSGNRRSSASFSSASRSLIRLEQPGGGEPEYDHVREDGVWGEEATLVGWILVGGCKQVYYCLCR